MIHDDMKPNNPGPAWLIPVALGVALFAFLTVFQEDRDSEKQNTENKPPIENKMQPQQDLPKKDEKRSVPDEKKARKPAEKKDEIVGKTTNASFGQDWHRAFKGVPVKPAIYIRKLPLARQNTSVRC